MNGEGHLAIGSGGTAFSFSCVNPPCSFSVNGTSSLTLPHLIYHLKRWCTCSPPENFLIAKSCVTIETGRINGMRYKLDGH